MGSILSITISTDNVFSCFQNCTAGKATYIRQLDYNLDALQTALEELVQARNDVITRVTVAEQQQMKRLNKVQLWLTRVHDLEIEVGQLQEDGTQEIQKLCLGGYCSKNLISSCKLGQKVVERLQLVTNLKAEGAFDVVAEWVPAAAVTKRTVDQPIIIGQEKTLGEVWRCLQEQEVGIVGIYGMGGVGKTTLLTQINNKLFDMLNNFDIAIWVTVSKGLQLQKIQEEIGKKLCLSNDSWNNKRLEDKAQDIFEILSKKKFVLLLDDIWDGVDLSQVGVPLPDPINSSKVVFTTRFVNVCGLMEAQKKFKVKCLPPEEAWELFKMKVGENTLNHHHYIPKLAKTMAEECDGLPIALITIGRAMVDKSAPEEWKHEIELLRSSASQFQGMQIAVYPQLKFSYDKLPNDKIKSCFLYCSLFPEDYRIHKRTLIDYWISEGFLNENYRSRSQNEGYSIVGTLIRACLLEEEDNYVKMHDVIRDMALWIATEIKRENRLVHAGAGLTEVPEAREWEGVRRISLMENKIKDISKTRTCPHLQTLFLNRNYLKKITGDFFHSMHSLRILNLSNNPSLTQLLSGVSKMVALRHLDLSNTGIEELPEELALVENLKYLNLEHTIYLRTIPEVLIYKFSGLHVLRVFECGYSGEVLTGNLLRSQKLDMLSINLKSSSALQKFLNSRKLKRCTQTLGLQRLDDTHSLGVLFLADMKHLNTLCISECKNLEELAMDCAPDVRKIQSHGFHSLHTIEICSCPKVRDLTWVVFVPNLKILSILHCSGVEEVINIAKFMDARKMMKKIVGRIDPFVRLEILQLEGLPNLSDIFQGALPFPQLKEIRVLQCPKLIKLPLDPQNAEERELLIRGKENWWKELQWKDRATRNAFRPCFKSIEAEFELPSHADFGDESVEDFEDRSDAESELPSHADFEDESDAELELPSNAELEDNTDLEEDTEEVQSLRRQPLLHLHRQPLRHLDRFFLRSLYGVHTQPRWYYGDSGLSTSNTGHF